MKRPSARRILSAILAADPKRSVPIAVAAVLASGLAAVGPRLIGILIDRGIIDHRLEWILIPLVAYLVVAGVSLVAGFQEVRLTGKLAQHYLRNLRRDLLAQLFYMDLDFFNRERSGRVVSRLTVDVENVQQFAERGLSIIIRGIFGILLVLILMVWASFPLTLVVTSVLLGVVLVTRWFMKRGFAAQTFFRDRIGDFMAEVNETVSGVRVVRGYGLEAIKQREFDLRNHAVSAARMKAAAVNARFYPSLEFLRLATVGLVVGVGALLASGGRATPGVVVAFTLYAAKLFEPVQQLSEISFQLQTAAASFSKIIAFLEERPMVREEPNAVLFSPGPGEIRLQHVSFAYDPRAGRALEDVDLTIVPGEKVALVGPSGAGKSTIAKLVARFYHPSDGKVMIDGQDLRHVTTASLRRHLSLVPQEGFLFNGTIAENIAVSRSGASREEIEQVWDMLGVSNAFSFLPLGLDTPVFDGGGSLSAGQRQLVSLARALLPQPGIILLDEATSNVDSATELVIQEALRTLLMGRTAIIIAHRVSTALQADRVVLLSRGRVVQDGPPEKLLRSSGPFANWTQSEELEPLQG